jgi:hypothetical protein
MERNESVREQVGERAAELQRTILGMADEHPLLTVAGAFGVGYLLSGALYSRSSAKLLGLGARFLFGAMLKETLGSVLLGRRTEA